MAWQMRLLRLPAKGILMSCVAMPMARCLVRFRLLRHLRHFFNRNPKACSLSRNLSQ